MYKCIIIISIIILNMSCLAKEEERNQKVINYANFPQKVFGIDINKLSNKEVVNELISKKIRYIGYDEDGQIIKDKYPIIFETKYFIGLGVDKKKIIKVVYNFWGIGPVGNEIIIEFNKDYLEDLQKEITKLLGKPNFMYKNQKVINIYWLASDKSKSSVKNLSISPQGENTFSLSIMGKDFENRGHVK